MARKKFDINKHNFKYGTLENDNIFINPTLVDLAEVTGIETRLGIEKLLVIDKAPDQKQIISVVSEKYGLLRNEDFYPQIEQRLDDAGIVYNKRSINRNNRSFVVDYILEDENTHVNVKAGNDLIKPLIRVVNSYDGSNQTTGHFGFFRQICSNGLHVAQTQLSFNIRHRGNMLELAMPKIEDLVAAFMDNEYYSLHKIFRTMSEKPISDVEGFVKYTLGQTGLLKYEKSEKNPGEASVGAQFVIDIINAEAKELNTAPNLWLGYNAFNEYIHTQSNRVFMLQEQADRSLFDAIVAQSN